MKLDKAKIESIRRGMHMIREKAAAVSLAGEQEEGRQEIDALCDLALAALHPEGREQESIINELAAIADACADLHQNRSRANTDPIMQWDNAKLTLGTVRKARWIRDGRAPQEGSRNK